VRAVEGFAGRVVLRRSIKGDDDRLVGGAPLFFSFFDTWYSFP
jgi:hypothetical protein